MENTNTYKRNNIKPRIGFFPELDVIGETYPFIKIAKKCKEMGLDVVFFSHGGRYEKLVKDSDIELIRIEPKLPSISEVKYPGFDFIKHHSDEELLKIISREVSFFKKEKIDAIVQGTWIFCPIISSRVAKIPLIIINSGTTVPPYFKAGYATFPDEMENIITKLIPASIKNKMTNYLFLRHKSFLIKRFNRLAKNCKLNIRFKRNIDIIIGDYTFLCDDIDFLGLKPSDDFPIHSYINPILSDDLFRNEVEAEEKELINHIKKSNSKKILVTMGSSCDKTIFLEILNTLEKTNYEIIAIYGNILELKEIPKYDNIKLRKFVSSIKKIHEIVDLSIIHGGRGTTYTSAYCGKPIIGIPMDAEQQFNLDVLRRKGVGIRISKKYFNGKKLLKGLEKIFKNYNKYLKNAEELKKHMKPPNGDLNAAKNILKILKNHKKHCK